MDSNTPPPRQVGDTTSPPNHSAVVALASTLGNPHPRLKLSEQIMIVEMVDPKTGVIEPARVLL